MKTSYKSEYKIETGADARTPLRLSVLEAAIKQVREYGLTPDDDPAVIVTPFDQDLPNEGGSNITAVKVVHRQGVELVKADKFKQHELAIELVVI